MERFHFDRRNPDTNLMYYILYAKVSPFTIPALLGNTASGVIGIECGCQGPNYGVTSACASGGHAIGKNKTLRMWLKCV